jgi:hypothetical protein
MCLRSWCKDLMCTFLGAFMSGGEMFEITVIAELKAARSRTRSEVAVVRESDEPRNPRTQSHLMNL